MKVAFLAALLLANGQKVELHKPQVVQVQEHKHSGWKAFALGVGVASITYAIVEFNQPTKEKVVIRTVQEPSHRHCH